ncbi:MAG: CoA-binding protein [Ilumatobacteraceae bacterium]
MTSTWTPPSAARRLQILQQVNSIAIVGASSNPARASYFVATYLLGSTRYRLYFVSPRETEILGHAVYPTLASLPEVPDIVDVFRRSSELPAVATEAVDTGAKVFWAQLGLHNDEAVQIAAGAGLEVVTDRCLKIEHARFAGGLHAAGFDTGVIDSRRRRLV